METEFREKVLAVAAKGVRIIEGFFDGEEAKPEMVKEASRMIAEGVKVSNRNQVDQQVKRSQALRLIQFIPKANRLEYISITNPEAKPFLLARPERQKRLKNAE
jgi:hypothetical protein